MRGRFHQKTQPVGRGRNSRHTGFDGLHGCNYEFDISSLSRRNFSEFLRDLRDCAGRLVDTIRRLRDLAD